MKKKNEVKFTEIKKYLDEMCVEFDGKEHTITLSSIMNELDNITNDKEELFRVVTQFVLNVPSITSIKELSDVFLVSDTFFFNNFYELDNEKNKNKNYHYNILNNLLNKNKIINKVNIRKNMLASGNAKSLEYLYKMYATDEELKNLSENTPTSSRVEIILPKLD